MKETRGMEIIDEARCQQNQALELQRTKAGSSCLTLASTPFDDSAAVVQGMGGNMIGC